MGAAKKSPSPAGSPPGASSPTAASGAAGSPASRNASGSPTGSTPGHLHIPATIEPAPAVIDADENAAFDDEEEDSTLGDDTASSTASLTSSILNYRMLYGRRYHSETGTSFYWGSNDEAQSDSMDIAHHMFTLGQEGKLYLAPLDESKVKKALDIGCGTGIWSIDFADEFPECQVIGTDVSPIQPRWVPPNLMFEIEDCTQPWTFTSSTFDYIHMRYLIGCIPDWTALFKEAYKALKPGGWFETYETTCNVTSDDGTVTPESACGRWGGIFIEASQKIGRTFTVLEQDLQRKAMEEAGFVDIQQWDGKLPLSPWPKDPRFKEIGRYGELFSTHDTEGFILFVANTLGWSREEIQVYIALFRREIRSPTKIHPYIPLRTVWGRKPEKTA